MATPLPPSKKSVDLSLRGGAVSRIRRDPPPPPPKKQLTRAEIREREAWAIALGVTLFAVALFTILVAVNIGPGWSPRQMEIVIEDR